MDDRNFQVGTPSESAEKHHTYEPHNMINQRRRGKSCDQMNLQNMPIYETSKPQITGNPFKNDFNYDYRMSARSDSS